MKKSFYSIYDLHTQTHFKYIFIMYCSYIFVILIYEQSWTHHAIDFFFHTVWPGFQIARTLYFQQTAFPILFACQFLKSQWCKAKKCITHTLIHWFQRCNRNGKWEKCFSISSFSFCVFNRQRNDVTSIQGKCASGYHLVYILDSTPT